ncbi:MAG TPA: lytic transglycosylase domain-containing protein [Actinomycetes bacterium]|nr:lytic transglycosylase domain-containing protein [Actinomycetes bacterium]
MTATAPSAERPTGLLAAAATLAAAVLLVSVVGARVAAAESADDAQARADAVAAQVDDLQAKVDQARLRYEQSLAGLAGVVTRAVSSDDAAMRAAEQQAAVDASRVQALRALDQSGGSLGVMNTIFSAESPADLAARWQLSQQVMSLLSSRSDGAADETHSALMQAHHWQAAAERKTASVDTVEASYAELQSLLDQQQTLLDGLDARAKRLATAERLAAKLAAERAAAASAASNAASSATAQGIPTNFLALYRAAATTCAGLPWPVLAAVGQVESGHGSNNGPSASGAEGPMQFLPSTFAAYAVDGDGDGDADIWDPADSIYTAAKYLCANGGGAGPNGLYTALWHYNHADWYVLMVASVAGQIAERFGEPAPVVSNS